MVSCVPCICSDVCALPKPFLDPVDRTPKAPSIERYVREETIAREHHREIICLEEAMDYTYDNTAFGTRKSETSVSGHFFSTALRGVSVAAPQGPANDTSTYSLCKREPSLARFRWLGLAWVTTQQCIDELLLIDSVFQVNVPKTRRTYCKGKDCKKHTLHKVTQYKAGKVRHPHRSIDL